MQKYQLLLLATPLMAYTSNISAPESAHTVRLGTALSPAEQAYRAQRLPLIKQQIEALLGTSLTDAQVPTIAFACSGGGFRAMYATLGMLEGAQAIGLLDATMYLACLSGSTWLTYPWMLDGRPITQYKEHVLQTGHKGFWRTARDMTKALATVAKDNLKHGTSKDIIDGYADFLARRLFAKEKRELAQLTLSQFAERIPLQNYPLPIGTAVYPSKERDYHWVEFTPFEVASKHIGGAIPPALLGSIFEHGVLAHTGKEPTIGYLMGVFGSAFSMSVRDIITHGPHRVLDLQSLTEHRWYKKMQQNAKHSRLANHKVSAARIPNFGYGMTDSPMHERKKLTLVDGGFITDLPIAPLLSLKRAVDIIFVLDSSREKAPTATMLRLAETDAKANGLPFPPINYTMATTQALSIFRDDANKHCPIIVYIPLRKNARYNERFDPATDSTYHTVNFSYRKKQAERLAGLPAYVLTEHRQEIKQLLADVAQAKAA